MKPPKAIRGVVNTLFGINKKPKEGTKYPTAASSASVPARTSFDDLEVIERRRTASHREEFITPVSQQHTLPRRENSRASETPTSSQEPFDHRRESRLASQSRSQPIEFENHKRVDERTFSQRALSLPTNGSSNPDGFFNRRSVSTSSAQGQNRRRSQELILSDYDEKIQFSNLSKFPKSNSSGCKNNAAVCKDTKPHRMSTEINNNEKPLLKQIPSPNGSTDKLVSCLDALDRLSQQVKRINEVSEKVKKVEKYSQHDPKKEKHLRELNMAAAASMRIKSLIKSEFDRAEDGNSRHSSQSSGYASDSIRKNSTSPTNTRQPTIDKLYKDIRQHNNTLPPIRRSQMDLSYPQSVQDMMPIWDEKNRQRMAYEGSVSSGYMTGSSSEEDQRITPPMESFNNHNNSMYTQQNWNHQHQRYSHHPPQHQGYFPGYEYDPNYEYYSMYGQKYDGSMSRDSGNHDDDVYGYYGYASSSIQDGDLYAGNGWYRLPSVSGRQPEQVAPSHPQMVHAAYHQQQQRDWSATQDSNAHKYGGLAGLFYDPNTKLSAPMMPPLAYDSSRDETSSVCSFNHGGNTMSMPSKNTSKTSKKTVRFSQTVRQRVETEESEMEDSTGVIKACRDEGNDKILTKKDLEKQQQTFEGHSDQSIYYWPNGVHLHPQIQQQLNYY